MFKYSDTFEDRLTRLRQMSHDDDQEYNVTVGRGDSIDNIIYKNELNYVESDVYIDNLQTIHGGLQLFKGFYSFFHKRKY